MEMSRRALSLGVMVFFAVGTVVLADPPTVSVQQQAELLSPGLGIFVRVVVDCGDGPIDGNLQVAVRQGEITSANIDTAPAAEGRQEVEVFIGGPFVPGEASASASLECGGLVQGLDLGATIKISE
jgi:hypothetical protein